jgi:hypothetical protein
MKLKNTSKSFIIKLVCILYVLLFIYAAMSKLLDFENFQVQLGQSPLLSSFAVWISWLVPFTELITAGLLMFQKWRSLGLQAAFSLMTMFTVYIFIILHYSSFIPCSCGGILEKMSWNIHLIFNIVFVLLAVTAILLNENLERNKAINYNSLPPIKSIPLILFLSTSVIVVLFLCSEEIMHYNNPFIRRYIRRSVSLVHSKDLQFNSYYFAGSEDSKLYLGNYTTPLHILDIDTSFKIYKTHRIDFINHTIPFRAVKIIVKARHFYLMDGSVPCMYVGSTKNWKLKTNLKGVPNFTIAEPIDSTSFVFRNNTGYKSANILGVYSGSKIERIHYAPVLLQKQVDGIFDTDGMLEFNGQTDQIIYTYFYRNEFFTADKNGVLLKRGYTIDTISKAKIKVAVLREGKRLKMAAPPLIVNAKSTSRNNLLFIESKVKGSYEDDEMWKQASVIDVYNTKKNSYVLSFPIFGNHGDKLQSIFVTDSHFYAIVGTTLRMYRLHGILKKEMKPN